MNFLFTFLLTVLKSCIYESTSTSTPGQGMSIHVCICYDMLCICRVHENKRVVGVTAVISITRLFSCIIHAYMRIFSEKQSFEGALRTVGLGQSASPLLSASLGRKACRVALNSAACASFHQLPKYRSAPALDLCLHSSLAHFPFCPCTLRIGKYFCCGLHLNYIV